MKLEEKFRESIEELVNNNKKMTVKIRSTNMNRKLILKTDTKGEEILKKL